MKLDTQFKLKSNKIYLNYLHENSYWYKILNRDPDRINDFIQELKVNYGLRPSDKINKMLNTFEMISSIFSAIK